MPARYATATHRQGTLPETGHSCGRPGRRCRLFPVRVRTAKAGKRVFLLFLTACLMGLLVGCASVPRYATHTIIPLVEYHHASPVQAIAQLNEEIRRQDPKAPLVEIDRSLPHVRRPWTLRRFKAEMDGLEKTYLASLPSDFETESLTFGSTDASIQVCCGMLKLTLGNGVNVTYRPDRIVFRYAPKEAEFRLHHCQPSFIKWLPNLDEEDRLWLGSRMLSVRDGTGILFVGTRWDHAWLDGLQKYVADIQSSDSTLDLLAASCQTGVVAQKWQPTELAGSRGFKLLDDKVVLAMEFGADGGVAVTIGRVGGPVTAPAFNWNIDDQGVLILSNPDGTPFTRMKKLCEKGDRIGIEWVGKQWELQKIP